MAAFVLAGCGPSKEELTSQVKASMEETLPAKVLSLVLVHEGNNKYSGSAELDGIFGVRRVSVEVVCDGESFYWKIVN